MTANDGSRALAAVADQRPDLLILDVGMPGIDGFEVCRRLRADGDDIPVVFLTARDASEDKVSGFTKGGDDYLTKPFSLEELIARVRAVLRRTQGKAEVSNRLEYADLEHHAGHPRRAADPAVADGVQAAALPHGQPCGGSGTCCAGSRDDGDPMRAGLWTPPPST